MSENKQAELNRKYNTEKIKHTKTQIGYTKKELEELQKTKPNKKSAEYMFCDCSRSIKSFGMMDLVRCEFCRTLYQPIFCDGIIQFVKVDFPPQKVPAIFEG